MRRLTLTTLLTAACAFAQAGDPVTAAVRNRYEAVKRNLIEAAEAMPADQYTFKLSPAQRAYSEWIAHTAGANESACAAMTGAGTAAQDHSAHGGAAKAEAVKMLRESFATCDAAFAGMTDAKAVAPVGAKEVKPITPMVNLVTTLNSHYGNMVGYLRSKGITPPSTARTMKQ